MSDVAQDDRRQLDRCLAIEIELARAASETVEETDWGAILLSPTIPLVWDASWILVQRAGMSAAEIAALADEAIGGAGMEHRTVVVDDPDEGARLVPAFEALGWDLDRGVYMVWRRGPDREPDAPVAQFRHAELEELRRELIRGGLPTAGAWAESTVEQLIEWDRRMGRAGGDRWFAADAKSDLASACRLFATSGVGQVEDVGTLGPARGRGLARAVTLAAARASRAEGHELTFLGALADDWPRLLYERLGFDPIGPMYSFRRKPPPG